ncbi:MAG: GTPase HflX [Lentisphaeraceae bacterium]|nr:GTPase HflX [Lentisphaeraceae bacterium]
MFEIREKPQKVERAFLVGIQFQDQTQERAEELLHELEELSDTFGVKTVGSIIVKIRETQARFLCGTGKTAEIIEKCREAGGDVIIFDEALTPSQQRNWERETENILVIDRREVILDIFSDRATTKEANLQIELARAEYDLPRLARAWTHLSRQRGGTLQRGEGERQIELDRRMIRKRIQQLHQELKKVRKQRETQRKQRRKRPVPNAAIVGYTNAGKSSLLNLLTDSDVLADDKLFATLDPTTRKIALSNNQPLLLTDTVGFIRKLPHDLVEAFKATLEEAVLADFLIHVIDASNEDAEEHIIATNTVLAELGADKKRTLTIFNKVDKVEDPRILTKLRMLIPDSHFISVKDTCGIDKLVKDMEDILEEDLDQTELIIPAERYDIISLVHRTSHIFEEEFQGNSVNIKASIPANIHGKIKTFIVSA